MSASAPVSMRSITSASARAERSAGARSAGFTPLDAADWLAGGSGAEESLLLSGNRLSMHGAVRQDLFGLLGSQGFARCHIPTPAAPSRAR